MTFRNPASLAVLALIGLAAENRLAAQPVVPNRPRPSAFQNLFFPGSQAVPNAGYGPGYGPQLMNRGGAFGVVPGNMVFGQQGGINPATATTPTTGVASGQPVVFNNLGHWYSGNYGHWYPNGIASGSGVLGNTGTGVGGMSRGGPIMIGGPMMNTGGGVGIGVTLPLGGSGHRTGTTGRR